MERADTVHKHTGGLKARQCQAGLGLLFCSITDVSQRGSTGAFSSNKTDTVQGGRTDPSSLGMGVQCGCASQKKLPQVSGCGPSFHTPPCPLQQKMGVCILVSSGVCASLQLYPWQWPCTQSHPGTQNGNSRSVAS